MNKRELFGRYRSFAEAIVTAAALFGALAGASAPAHAAGNVYVTNQVDSTVSQYAIGDGGSLSPLVPPTVATGGPPDLIAVTPNGRSAYVALPQGLVNQYNIDPATGALSPKTPAVVAAEADATDVAVPPDGKSAYVTNSGPFGDSVSQYNIDPATGALSPKTPATVPAPDPYGIAVTPDGRSAYVTNDTLTFMGNLVLSSISQYNINPATGALSPKTPATVPTDAFPRGLAVAPNGKSAYVTNSLLGPGEVSQYNIDPRTGLLSPKTPATVAAGVSPTSVAVAPNGKSAYAANLGSEFGADAVSQYTVDPKTGALSPKTPATVAGGDEPIDLAVTSDRTSVYVANTMVGPGTVSQYNIDPMSGALSPKTPASIAAGSGVFGIAVRK
jgi:DNA-binding beta-propeller fold protein YncE